MKKLFLILSAISLSAQAQVLKTKLLNINDSESPSRLIRTYDNGYIVAGRNKSSTQADWDIFISKFDQNLDLLWSKTIATTVSEDISQIIETSSHELLVAFTPCSPGSYCDLVLVKLDEFGNLLWTKTYFYYYSFPDRIDLMETPGKNYAVLSEESAVFDIGSRIMLTDTSGNIISMQNIKRNDDMTSFFTGSVPGGFILHGVSELVPGGNSHFGFIAKVDTSGTFLWGTAFNGITAYEEFHFIHASVADDGGVLAVGDCDNFNPYVRVETVTKFDSSGNLDWMKSYSTTAMDTVAFVFSAKSGNNTHYLFGYLKKNGYKPIISEIDLNGNFLWSKYITIPADAFISEAVVEPGGTTVLTGSHSPSPSNAFILRTTLNSTLNCNETAITLTSSQFAANANTLFFNDTVSTVLIPSPSLSFASTGNDSLICLGSGLSEETLSSLSFSISPNPANQSVIISLHPAGAEKNKTELKIFDVMGKEMFQNKITQPTSNLKLQTSNFSNGIYFIQLSSENKTATQKLIVQH